MEIRNFRDLKLWRHGMSLAVDIYKVSKNFPIEERYGLTSQVRRAAISIPSNIAEGYNRWYKKEYIRFLYFARGSCAELETQIEIAFELDYLENETKEYLQEKINHEARMLSALINKL